MSGKKILIVDDQPNVRTVLAEMFKNQGYLVETAENGEVGIQKAREYQPELLIMDIMMPVKDGLSAAREIKADPDLQSIPILFLTARGQKQDEENARAAGADGFITKPFSPRRIMETVSSMLG
ncbi:MAG: response regulator [Leptospiraceae bacterium]|nr:response regulator [Leptospiraceae bacterium]MCB1314937.1 response regulator [Leptospiraceae bacterium]MCB1320135.1 response regulator [Leptospiraceae bacterium]